MNLEKELKHLEKIEKHWNKEIDLEIEQEKEIETLRENITSRLLNKSHIKISIFDANYDLVLIIKNEKKQGFLIVTDIDKFNIAGKKYKPMFIKGDFDTNHTVQRNIAAMVEGWLRHITGRIKPISEDEQD